MSHNSYSRKPVHWTDAAVPNARDFSIWDINQYKGIDGDNGGTWAPKTPIGIGGAGLQLSDNSLLQGGFKTQLGGRYVLGASDFPTFAADRTRTVRFPLRGMPGSSGVLYRQNFSIGGHPIHRSGWFDPGAGNLWFPVDQRFIHNGANISAIRVYAFQTQFLPILASPSVIFQAALYQADIAHSFAITTQWTATHPYTAGQLLIPLGAQAQTGFYYQDITAGTHSSVGSPPIWPRVINGIVNDGAITWQAVGYSGTIMQAFPYSASAYYNGGQPWTITMSPPAGAGFANSAAHSYAIGITQDGASWAYSAAEIDYTNIPNMAFE